MPSPTLWPWQAREWREFLEWRTDVVETEDGSEYSTQILDLPRQSWTGEFLVPSDRVEDALLLLQSGIRSLWALPLWSQALPISGVPAGATSISVSTAYRDFRKDYICLWPSVAGAQLLGVSAVSPTSLSLATPAQAVGACLLLPVRVASVFGQIGRQHNGREWVLTVNFRLETPLDLVAGASSVLFRGEDTLLDPPEFQQTAVTAELSSRQDTLDLELGRVYQVAPWARPRARQPWAQVCSGSQASWERRLWLFRRAGRFRRFWSPSWESDVQPLSLLSSGSVLRVSTNRTNPPPGRHLAFRKNDNTWVLRQITAYSAGSGYLDLTLDQPISDPLSLFEFVSWLIRFRLDSDRIELVYPGANVSMLSLTFAETSPGSDAPVAETFLWLDGLLGEVGTTYHRVLDPGAEPVDWSVVPTYNYEAP